MSDPEFLDVDDVLALHERQIAEFGGSPGIRDGGLLESAVGAAQATFGGSYVHDSLFAHAAAYAFHIAQNQPFIDGNKRTGRPRRGARVPPPERVPRRRSWR